MEGAFAKFHEAALHLSWLPPMNTGPRCAWILAMLGRIVGHDNISSPTALWEWVSGDIMWALASWPAKLTVCPWLLLSPNRRFCPEVLAQGILTIPDSWEQDFLHLPQELLRRIEGHRLGSFSRSHRNRSCEAFPTAKSHAELGAQASLLQLSGPFAAELHESHGNGEGGGWPLLRRHFMVRLVLLE